MKNRTEKESTNKTTLKESIIRALYELHIQYEKEYFPLQQIYDKVSMLRGVPNPNKGASIRGCLESNSSDSHAYNQRTDLFALKEKNTGMWGLRYFQNIKSIKELKQGERLTYSKLTELFKISGQSGIMRSYKTNSLVLTSSENNQIYLDSKIIDNQMIYTGEGKKGDQQLIRNNKLLANIKESKIPTYLFLKTQQGDYQYYGEVELMSDPYQVIEKNRLVWKFPLKILDYTYSEDEKIEEKEEYKEIINTVEKLEEKTSREICPPVSFKEGILPIKKTKTTNASHNKKRKKRPDYIAKQIIKDRNGRNSEEEIFKVELANVAKFGDTQAIKKMKEFFENKTDEEGYDILSYEKNEKGELIEKYIEVKSTVSDKNTPIIITANELKFAKENAENYYLYRMINSDDPQKCEVVFKKGDPTTYYEKEPIVFQLYTKEE